VFIVPPSSNTTPIRNSSSRYITSTIHQNPFRGVNQWGTLATAPTFTPSSHITLQTVTSTPIYTMKVNSYFGKIEKCNGRPSTISLREFKASFSTMLCELELKYGVNYIEVFAFKQLAHYVHYELLDVYEQHSPRILGVTQMPNPAYATTIATASQVALQTSITHHGTMPNNPNSVPTLVNLSLQQFIVATINIPRTIMHQFLLIQWGNSFKFLNWNFRLKVF
jgi:hypothetical protein